MKTSVLKKKQRNKPHYDYSRRSFDSCNGAVAFSG